MWLEVLWRWTGSRYIIVIAKAIYYFLIDTTGGEKQMGKVSSFSSYFICLYEHIRELILRKNKQVNFISLRNELYFAATNVPQVNFRVSFPIRLWRTAYLRVLEKNLGNVLSPSQIMPTNCIRLCPASLY